MKKKNVVVIIISVVVFVIAAALLYRYLFPPSADSNVKVIIPHPVEPDFNQEQLDTLKNDTVDFTQDINPAGEEKPADNSTPNAPNQPPSDSPQSSANPIAPNAQQSRR